MNGNKFSAAASFRFNTPVPSWEVAALFKGYVAAAEMLGPGDPTLLCASEIEQICSAGRRRVQEFAAGRACARCALKELGIKYSPLPIRENRQPNWPDGIIGSITHTNDYCAAVVAWKSQCKSIGLDAEVISGITPDLYQYICTPEERDCLSNMEPAMRAKTAAIIFSAKEAFYKCQYAITEEFLDFQDIQLDTCTLDIAEGRCRFRPIREIILTSHLAPPFEGRFCFSGELILSAFQFT